MDIRKYYVSKRTDSDWKDVPVASIDNLQWSPAVNITAQAQLSWDETALYVSLSASEEHIRAELNGPLQPVCEDSCLEFFFGVGDGRYFNFEFNPNKALYFGFGGGREERVRVHLNEDTLSPEVEWFHGGWRISYRIPVSLIRQFYPDFVLCRDLVLFGNFYKCGDETVVPHYLSWNWISSDEPDFHRPMDFGRLILR